VCFLKLRIRCMCTEFKLELDYAKAIFNMYHNPVTLNITYLFICIRTYIQPLFCSLWKMNNITQRVTNMIYTNTWENRYVWRWTHGTRNLATNSLTACRIVWCGHVLFTQEVKTSVCTHVSVCSFTNFM